MPSPSTRPIISQFRASKFHIEKFVCGSETSIQKFPDPNICEMLGREDTLPGRPFHINVRLKIRPSTNFF